MTFTLICPTRSRPDQMRRMWQSALATAHNPENLHLILGLDDKGPDEEKAAYLPYHSVSLGDVKRVAVHYMQDHGIVHGINVMARALMQNYQNTLFMIAPDDVIFTTPHWDKAITDHYAALKNKAHVYCMRDSRDPNGTPHPIMTREYVDMMGYFFPPIFLHWYVDTWTADIAKSCGIFTHLLDYELVHDKPSDRGKLDDTHYRPRARGWHERDTFVNMTCQHFLEGEKERLARLMQQAMGTREHLD